MSVMGWQWYPRGMKAWVAQDDLVYGLVDVEGSRWFAFHPDPSNPYFKLEDAFAHGQTTCIFNRMDAVENAHGVTHLDNPPKI